MRHTPVQSSRDRLKTIESAARASEQAALSAFVDKVREVVVALFALMSAFDTLPVVVVTLVVFLEVLCHLLNFLLGWGVGSISTGDVSSSEQQPSLIPDRTGAQFPGRATDIAELVPTATSVEREIS